MLIIWGRLPGGKGQPRARNKVLVQKCNESLIVADSVGWLKARVDVPMGIGDGGPTRYKP